MFDFLEIRTLSLLVGLNSVAMAGTMVYISMTRLTYPGFHHWTLSFVLGGLGMVLISLRHIAPDWASIIIANLCILAFPALLSTGLANFLNRPCRFGLPVLVLAIILMGFIYFTYWQPSVIMRVVLISIGIGFLLAHSLLMLIRNAQPQVGFNNTLLNTILAILVFWLVLRIVISLTFEWKTNDFLSSGVLQGVSIVFFSLGCFFIMGGLLTLNAQRMESELASADQEIENISRLIPICASCKKIRDDEGYWEAVETYIQRTTNKDLTHGICPECARKLYPEIDLEDDIKGLNNKAGSKV